MVDLDFDNLTMGVERRLDEIFAEELHIGDLQSAKLKFVKPPSLASLRNIIMSLEWGVTDEHIKDLMQELSKLQRAYIKDNQHQKLLKILFYLGEYIRVYQSDTHPNVYRMLFRAFNSLAKIASGKYSNHQKAKIVSNEINRYLSLRSYLKRKNKQIYRPTVKKLNKLDKNLLSSIDSLSKQKPYHSKDATKIYYSNLNDNFKKLKKFIYIEIKKLRKDLQSMVALIQKKNKLDYKYSRLGKNNLIQI